MTVDKLGITNVDTWQRMSTSTWQRSNTVKKTREMILDVSEFFMSQLSAFFQNERPTATTGPIYFSIRVFWGFLIEGTKNSVFKYNLPTNKQIWHINFGAKIKIPRKKRSKKCTRFFQGFSSCCAYSWDFGEVFEPYEVHEALEAFGTFDTLKHTDTYWHILTHINTY